MSVGQFAQSFPAVMQTVQYLMVPLLFQKHQVGNWMSQSQAKCIKIVCRVMRTSVPQLLQCFNASNRSHSHPEGHQGCQLKLNSWSLTPERG